MPIALQQPRHLRVGASAFLAANNFACDALGTECSRLSKRTINFRSDSRDYTLCFVEGKCEPAVAGDVCHINNPIGSTDDIRRSHRAIASLSKGNEK